MYKIVCHTNLDLCNEQWPRELPRIPVVGEEIQSAKKWGSFQLSLTVVAVRWKCRVGEITDTWVPEIELHYNKNISIREFYEWYAPLTGNRVSRFI